jgi:hypothetical protein
MEGKGYSMASFEVDMSHRNGIRQGKPVLKDTIIIVECRCYLPHGRSPQLRPRCLWRCEKRVCFRSGPETLTIWLSASECSPFFACSPCKRNLFIGLGDRRHSLYDCHVGASLRNIASSGAERLREHTCQRASWKLRTTCQWRGKERAPEAYNLIQYFFVP